MATFVVRGTPVGASISRSLIYAGTLVSFVGLYVAAQVGARRKVRKDRCQLGRLSDRMLADLGLSRSDIA